MDLLKSIIKGVKALALNGACRCILKVWQDPHTGKMNHPMVNLQTDAVDLDVLGL